MIIRVIGKISLVCVVLLIFGWLYWTNGSHLSDDKVKAFYNRGGIAVASRKPDALCDLLASDYENIGPLLFDNSKERIAARNKEQVCSIYNNTFRQFDVLGKGLGGLLKIQYSFTITKITFSANKTTATVDVYYSLDAGDTLMNTRVHSVDTLVQRNGKILLLKSLSQI